MKNVKINGITTEHYKVTEDGQVYNSEGHKMTQFESNSGYLRVKLSRGVPRKMYSVHRIVAETYLENPKGYTVVNHKDCNRKNNSVENLEWCTHTYNNKYTYTIGGMKGTKRKPVHQFNLETGEYIRTWESPIEVTRAIGISHQNISKVCLGLRHHAGGYKWSY